MSRWNQPVTIFGETIGHAWISYLQEVAHNGHLYHDGDVQIIERENITLHIERDDPADEILIDLADKRVLDLYMRKMQEVEIVPELNASYGKRLFDQMGINQVEWVCNRLRLKPEAKSATITLMLPDDPGPSIPCLVAVDFKLRDNTIHSKAFFRSQNACRAYGNLRALFWLAGEVAAPLMAQVGPLFCFVSNAHFQPHELDNCKAYRDYVGPN